MKDERLYLEHILECIGKIEEDTQGGRDVFFATHMVQDAVRRNLQVLGESIQRLSEATKLAYPDIDWRAIRGFRNLLVHEYFDIDLKIVWRAIQADLPSLADAVRTVLKEKTDAERNEDI